MELQQLWIEDNDLEEKDIKSDDMMIIVDYFRSYYI